MMIFLLFSILLFSILLISRGLISSAKRNLFKDQAAWSGEDIKIKYSSKRKPSETKENDNILEMIANESQIFLEEQLRKEKDETK